MLTSRRIADMLRRHPPEKDFPPVAAENGIVFLEDTEKQSFYGACFSGLPMTGMDDTAFAQLQSAISGNYPPNTFVQFCQLSVPDIDDYAHQWAMPKFDACDNSPMLHDEQRASLREATVQQAEFFINGKEHPHIRSTGMRLHRVIQIACIKLPVSSQPSDTELQTCTDLIEKFEQSIATAGMQVRRTNTAQYLSLLRFYFNPYGPEETWYDEMREVRDQVLPPGYMVDNTQSKELLLNGTRVRILSPKRFPSMMHMSYINLLQGEPGGTNNQLPIPWAMTLTIRLPDRQKKAGWFERRFQALTLQAGQSSITRWVPQLAQKKADADLMKAAMDNGEMPCEACFNFMLYSRDPEELNRLSAQMTTYAAGMQLELVEDSEILWPLFWNNLPLFPSDTSIEQLNRYWSMTVPQSLHCAPLTAEWMGGHKGSTLLMETRRGLPLCYDLYDTASNFNSLVFASSGSGKTYMTQSIVTNYLAEGSRVWIVDIGRGYYKLCKAFGGEYIEFSESSEICLNPFTNVVDIDEEMDLIISVLSKMAAPTEGLSEYQRARAQEAVKAVWSSQGNAMTITNVASWMDLQDDERVRDMAKMLLPYTINGQFGVWFEGENNLNFSSNLVVLELEELAQKPTLQQVVLMILMSKIQHDMYLTKNTIKKLAVFDEAWMLFDDPGVAKFLNHAFRRFRKYNGAAMLVVQDVGDFYKNPELVAVAANAAHKFILRQEGESIDRAVASGHLALDSYGVSQLKTVHTAPGAYSEIMFLQGGAWTIARLVQPRFMEVLFSSKGAERDLIIEAVSAGMPVHEAINSYIRERG